MTPAAIELGEPVEKLVALSYLEDLQVCSHTFVGLSRDDLEVLIKHFSVHKVTQNTNFWNHGCDAASFALLLRGKGTYIDSDSDSASGGRCCQVIGHLRRGDYAGASEWLQSRENVPCARKSTLRLTGTINILLVCPFEAVEALCRMDPGGAAVRFLRLVAMGATAHAMMPAGAPSLDLRGQPIMSPHNVQLALSSSALFEDLSPEQMGAVLEAAEMVSFVAGDPLFHAGQQAGAVYCLVRGELDVRQPRGGGHVCTISAPGEVLGESVLPFVTHKRDVTASSRGEMLRITPEGLQQLHVREPVVGYKLLKNLVRDTLSKMDQLFGVQSLIHHPVWLTRSREEGLLAEESLAAVAEALRVAALEAQDQLDEASASKMGTFKRHEWRHRATSDMSVPQLLELLAAQRNEAAQRARDQHLRHEEHLLHMVPKKDMEAVLQDLDASKKREMEARRRLNHTLETMDKLEADLHAERVKYVKENESLKAELAKTETRLGEVEEEIHKEREMAKKQVDDLTERVVKSRKELLSYEQGARPQARDDLLCQVYTDEVKQMQSLMQTQSQKLKETQEKSDYLQFKVDLLTDQLRVQEARELRMNEDEFEDSMDSEYERAIPELQASLASSNYDKAQARWAIMTHRLVAKKSTKNQFMEMIKALKANKAKKDDLVVSRAEAEKLQNLCTDLRSQLNAATAQAQSHSTREHEKAGVAHSAICMLGHLVGCLAKRVFKLEFQSSQRPEAWEQPHLDLLKKGWSFLADRGLLKPEFLDIDIQAAIQCRADAKQFKPKRLSVPDSISSSMPMDGLDKRSPVHNSPHSGSSFLERLSPSSVLRAHSGPTPSKQASKMNLQGSGARRTASGDQYFNRHAEALQKGSMAAAMPVRRVQSQPDTERALDRAPFSEHQQRLDPTSRVSTKAREWSEDSHVGYPAIVKQVSTCGLGKRPTTSCLNLRSGHETSPAQHATPKESMDLRRSLQSGSNSSHKTVMIHGVESAQPSPARALKTRPRHPSPSRREAARGVGGPGRSMPIPSGSNWTEMHSGDNSTCPPVPTMSGVGSR